MSGLNIRKCEEIEHCMKSVLQNNEQDTLEVIPDDCEISPKTPIGTQNKIRRKAKCKRTLNDNHDETSVSSYVEKYTIESTKMGSSDFNKPYMYHSLREALNYKENYFPKNNNIHLIGKFNFSQHRGFQLVDICKNQRINLDFSLTGEVPKEMGIISVFGSLEFNRAVPVFVVRFFRREVEITIMKYIENLKALRSFIPMEYFKIIQCNRS